MGKMKVVDGKEMHVETFVEFNGMQVNVEELTDRAKDAYVASGHNINEVDSVKLYINANERRVYYLVNDKPEGKFIEF